MYFVLGLFLLSSLSWAIVPGTRCTSVDLRKTSRGKIWGPPRNQGSLPWCTTFSMADFMSFYLQKKISAAGIAVTWLNRYQGEGIRSTRLRAGADPMLQGSPGVNNLIKLYEGIRPKFQCLESDFPSNDNAMGEFQKNLAQISDVKRTYDSTRRCPPNGIREIQELYPKLQGNQILRILNHSLLQDLHANLMSSNCRETKISAPKWDLQTSRNFATVDRQLSKGKPLLFMYHSSVLRNPAASTDSQNHASMIVGRRMRAGKCEYLVRNSWGRNCGYYHSSYACEEGHIWIPGDSLKRNTRAVTYLP